MKIILGTTLQAELGNNNGKIRVKVRGVIYNPKKMSDPRAISGNSEHVSTPVARRSLFQAVLATLASWTIGTLAIVQMG